MTTWTVIVGNIGTVYEGCNSHEAQQSYKTYVSLSQQGYGRGGDEVVTLIKGEEIVQEHLPDLDEPHKVSEGTDAHAYYRALQRAEGELHQLQKDHRTTLAHTLAHNQAQSKKLTELGNTVSALKSLLRKMAEQRLLDKIHHFSRDASIVPSGLPEANTSSEEERAALRALQSQGLVERVGEQRWAAYRLTYEGRTRRDYLHNHYNLDASLMRYLTENT